MFGIPSYALGFGLFVFTAVFFYGLVQHKAHGPSRVR